MEFKFLLDDQDVKAISEAMAEAPFKNVNVTVQKMQAQINQQIKPADEMTAPTNSGAENGGIPINHSS